MKKYLTLTVIVALGMVTEGFDIPKQYIDGVNRSFDIYMEEVLSPYGHSGWITEETMPYLKGERIKSHKNFVKSQLDEIEQLKIGKSDEEIKEIENLKNDLISKGFYTDDKFAELVDMFDPSGNFKKGFDSFDIGDSFVQDWESCVSAEEEAVSNVFKSFVEKENTDAVAEADKAKAEAEKAAKELKDAQSKATADKAAALKAENDRKAAADKAAADKDAFDKAAAEQAKAAADAADKAAKELKDAESKAAAASAAAEQANKRVTETKATLGFIGKIKEKRAARKQKKADKRNK